MQIVILEPKKCFWLAIAGWGVAEILNIIFDLVFAIACAVVIK